MESTTDQQIVGFSVEPITDCPHFQYSTYPGNITKLLQEQGENLFSLNCQFCDEKFENWVCLECLLLGCSRQQNSHLLKHNQEIKHPIALSLADGSYYCYDCDSYITNPEIKKLMILFSQTKFPQQEIQNPKQEDKQIELQQQQKQQQNEKQIIKEEKINLKSEKFDIQNSKFIFVYGTLKPGHNYVAYNQRLYNNFNIKFAKSKLEGYTLLFQNYATLYQKRPTDHVEGYILTVDNDKFEKFEQECDRIEGYPSFYKKIQVKVTILEDQGYGQGQTVDCFSYQMRDEHFDVSQSKELGNLYTQTDFLNQ